jgi:hypothetical protein
LVPGEETIQGRSACRIEHLVRHAVHAATGLGLEDFPDRCFWDAAVDCGDTWSDAAVVAHDEIIYLFDDSHFAVTGGIESGPGKRAWAIARRWIERLCP